MAGVEDLKFLVGDQWDEWVKQSREAARKPVLTINRLPAFVAQVLGSRLENETTIKIRADQGGTRQEAMLREGLVRNILKQSRAEMAFDNAMAGSVQCGIGNFQVEMEYESDDVWNQVINIAPIPDHFSVKWDRHRSDPTGKDANRCFVEETMSYDAFMAEYPWATPADIVSDKFPMELMNSGWYDHGDVRIVAYWAMRKHRRTVALMRTGATVDITDLPEDSPAFGNIAQYADGTPYVREVMRPYAQMYRCSGADILEGPYDLPVSRIPVYRVPGWEIKIGARMYRWGLLRFLKDPQRLHNFWRSVMAEKIMKSPKATWVVSDSAISGREDAWRKSNNSDDPLLIWNSESGQKPERPAPIQVEDALIAQASITTQDLKDVSNIHEANLGMPSNEVSGVAIKERGRVSATGTTIYHTNLEKAITEAGITINELMPIVFDTPRIMKIIGPDAKEMLQPINDMTNPDSIDITAAKYSVTVTTGKSYVTKQAESAESMYDLAQAMPNVMSVAADLIVEAQDWPGAAKIAARLRKLLPPNLLSPDEITPEIQQAAQAQSAQAQEQSQAVQQESMGKWIKAQSDAALNFARARKYGNDANAVPVKLRNESLRTASEVVSRELHDHLDAIDTAIS